MDSINFYQGLKNNLPESRNDSNIYITTDTGEMFLGDTQLCPPSELLDTSVKLSSQLKTYYNIGKITNASGTNPRIIGEAGDTLRDVFNNLFNMDETQPSITQNPSVSCSLSSSASDERGTSISSVSYTITFYDGAYTNASSTGVTMTNYSFSSGTASPSTSTKGNLTLPSAYIVGTSPEFSSTLTANHSQGNIAKTNLGNDSNPVIRIPSGSKTTTASFSKSAVDYPYYISCDASTIEELEGVMSGIRRQPTSLTDESGYTLGYNANSYVWILVRKGDTSTQPTKTIQAYSDLADEWGTFLGGTLTTGSMELSKSNGVTDEFFAYRTRNMAVAADSAKFRLI